MRRFQRLFEPHGAGDFERHLGRIDRVVGAVIDSHPEIDHREPP